MSDLLILPICTSLPLLMLLVVVNHWTKGTYLGEKVVREKE